MGILSGLDNLNCKEQYPKNQNKNKGSIYLVIERNLRMVILINLMSNPHEKCGEKKTRYAMIKEWTGL
jgi:hypothetical protein